MEVRKGVRRKRTERHEASTRRYSRGIRAGWKRAEEGSCGMHKVAEGGPPIFSAEYGSHGVNACAGQEGVANM